MKINARSMN